MAELLRTPVPYRTTNYALPAAPLHYAQAVPMPDGAQIATYGRNESLHPATQRRSVVDCPSWTSLQKLPERYFLKTLELRVSPS